MGSSWTGSRKKQELGFPRFLAAVSASLHRVPGAPSGAASEDSQWTATQMSLVAVHLAAESLKFSMAQQLYVAKHLDIIVMVLGDGTVPGSLGLPYWCDRCLRLLVAVGCWFLFLRSNGQWKWFCPFCGG